MKKYRYLFIGILSVVFVIFFLWWGVGGGNAPWGEFSGKNGANFPPEKRADIMVRDAPSGGGGSVGLGSGGMKSAGGIYDAENLKEYYERVKTNPQQGGYFYAQAAITSCRQKMSLLKIPDHALSVDAIVREKQKIAKDNLKKLCEKFNEQDIKKSYLDLQREGRSLGDPLIIAQQDLIDSTTKDEFNSALKNIFAKKDVYLASSLWPNFGRIGSFDGSGENKFFFDGKDYSRGEDFKIYQAAWQIVPCVSGARCGMKSDTVLISACLENGICLESREELVLKQFKADHEAYKAVPALAERMSNAVWNGQYELFFPEK